MATVEVEGLRGLEKALEDLTAAAGKGVLRGSLKKAATPMADLMSDLAPRGETATDRLAESVTIGTKLSKRQAAMHRRMFKDDRASVELFVGPSYTLGEGGRHGHLLEFGTAPHVNGGVFTGTQHPGTAPQPFVRPAWDQEGQPTLDRLAELLWQEFEKSSARARAKAARG